MYIMYLSDRKLYYFMKCMFFSYVSDRKLYLGVFYCVCCIEYIFACVSLKTQIASIIFRCIVV